MSRERAVAGGAPSALGSLLFMLLLALGGRGTCRAAPGAPPPDSAAALGAARAFLSLRGPALGIRDPQRDLALLRDREGPGRRRFLRFQQLHQGIPVLAGELIVEVGPAGQVLSLGGETLRGTDGGGAALHPAEPRIGAGAARDIALGYVVKHHRVPLGSLNADTPRLWYYDPRLLGPAARAAVRLVWRLEVTSRALAPLRELVLVDALDGSVALHMSRAPALLRQSTHDAGNATVLPGRLVCDESSPACPGGDAETRSVHQAARDTWSYFEGRFGRQGLTADGLAVRATVHYGRDYPGAFWNGQQAVFGDRWDLALADDVVAHELVHGVIEAEAGLFPWYQSGAVAEALADLWGELVDQGNGTGNDGPGVRWLIGEDVLDRGPFRDLRDPPRFRDPDRMTSPFYQAGIADQGGIHTNSGVGAKAFSLLADGGSFNGFAVRALGVEKVSAIAYGALTDRLTSAADYAELALALELGCEALAGTRGITHEDCAEVRAATLAVEMDQAPGGGPSLDAPPCVTRVIDRFWSGFEWGLGGAFRITALQGIGAWGVSDRNAVEGLWSLRGDDGWTRNDSAIEMTQDVSLPGRCYLHFRHAHYLEETYDGGVVEYSTDQGRSWNDAGRLFDRNGYSGRIATGFGNRLEGRDAFVGSSGGYLASRLDLAPLTGRQVRFRWRLATDGSFSGQGWYVDEVRIHTCEAPTSLPFAVWQASFPVLPGATFLVGDLDGDGRADLVSLGRSEPSAFGEVHVALSSGRDFGPRGRWLDFFAPDPEETVLVGDFTGDGRDDLAAWLATTSGQVYVAGSTGAAFSAPEVWRWDLEGSPGDVVLAGDANGDRREDLIRFARARGEVWVALSSGNRFEAPQLWHSFFAVSVHERPAVADLNGDGKADILTFATSSPTAFGDVYVALSTGSRFEDGLGSRKWHDWFAVDPSERPRLGDLDGDGKADILTFLAVPRGHVYGVINQGDGLGPNRLWREDAAGPADVPWAGDADGDGLDDIILHVAGTSSVLVSLTR